MSFVSTARNFVGQVAALMGYLAGWAFIACAIFISFDVLARAFLGFSSKATTEISGYMLAFGISWALAHTLAQRAHVRIDVLINRLPTKPRAWLHIVSLFALLLFIATLTKSAIDLVAESYAFSATDITILQTPLVVPQGLWAFGIFVLLIYLVLLLAENVALLLRGDAALVDRNISARTYDDEAAEALDAVAAAAQPQGDAKEPRP